MSKDQEPKMPENLEGMAGLAQLLKYLIEVKMYREEKNPTK